MKFIGRTKSWYCGMLITGIKRERNRGPMPYQNREPDSGVRTDQEAWDMALDNKYLMYQVLNKYVRSHSLPWYAGKDLLAELESFAWEGFFDACRRWDESKGFTLSTYAYPSITNALNARMKVLERMGTSMAGGYKKGEKVERPKLSSLDKLDEVNAKQRDEENRNVLSDLNPQPWYEPQPSMEDAVVDAIEQEALIASVHKILSTMQEPYATVFRDTYITEPTHERRPGGISLGSGLTLKEIGSKYGRDTTWVKGILDEAVEYIRHRLKAEGIEWDE